MNTKRNGRRLLPEDMIFVPTPTKADRNEPTKQTMDAALYPTRNAPNDGRGADWSRVELSFQFKNHTDDPFDETFPGNDPADSEHRASNLDQILSHAKLVFDHQHRTHHLTVIIFGRMARIVRWDRAGALITEKFDYKKEPHILGKFLFCYSRSDAVARGHDPTAVRVEPGTKEWELMSSRAEQSLLRHSRAVEEDARIAFQHSVAQGQPRWKLAVNTEKGAMHFLVGRPDFCASVLIGRGTRGYVAINMEDPQGSFVYLKDAWRVDHERIKQEGKILAALNEKDVPFIPHLVCHGDVPHQMTVNNQVWLKQNSDEKQTFEDDPFIEDEDDTDADHGAGGYNYVLTTSETLNVAIDEEDMHLEGSTVSVNETLMSEDDIPSSSGDEGILDLESSGPSEEDLPHGMPDERTDADGRGLCPLKAHKHYRLVVKEVAKPLSAFKDGRELVSILIHILAGTFLL